MDSIHIYGGNPLHGSLWVQGSKNAALPILAASVLISGQVVLEHCPEIADVQCMIRLLESIGCRVSREAENLLIDASEITKTDLPKEPVRRMRSSVILMGALLGRKRQVAIAYPGGCVIGERPIDIHLYALKQLGAEIKENGSMVSAQTKELTGNEIRLPFPSVGATENAILGAVLAKGETVITGAAREPEIAALCAFLRSAGANISSFEDECSLLVKGVEKLHSCTYRIPADRIVAGTYLLACMAAGGEIALNGICCEELDALFQTLLQMGGSLSCREQSVYLTAPERICPIPYIKTEVYPGYPTDLQSQLLAVLALADGKSIVEEAIFEDRFHVTKELVQMGARIQTDGKRAFISGVRTLHGAAVSAQELRGGAALCIAALAAQGESWIANRHFIDRGYERLEEDIRGLGGGI